MKLLNVLPTNKLRIINLELARYVGLEASLLLQYFFDKYYENLPYYYLLDIAKYTEFDYNLVMKCLRKLKKEKFIASYKFKDDLNIIVKINYRLIKNKLGN